MKATARVPDTIGAQDVDVTPGESVDSPEKRRSTEMASTCSNESAAHDEPESVAAREAGDALPALLDQPCDEKPETTFDSATTSVPDAWFDDVATINPVIGFDVANVSEGGADASSGTRTQLSVDRVAETLECLARRVRNGEIAVDSAARGDGDAVVLASVLTTLLSKTT